MGHHLDVLGRDVKMADLLDVVAGELENVSGYVLQHGHNVHRHLSNKRFKYSVANATLLISILF